MPAVIRLCMEVQVMVDIGTPKEVFDRVGDCVKAHVTEHALDFSGECSVNANVGGDPMKIALSIWWSYCYNGASALCCVRLLLCSLVPRCQACRADTSNLLSLTATSGRLFAARTKLLFVITDQLHKEGILYTLPPCTGGAAPAPGMASMPAPAAM